MRVSSSVIGLLMVVCAGTTLAQSRVDRSFRTTSKDCSGVVWSKEALATYPTIASACQAVEERNGKAYVKFEGTVQRNVERGKQLEVRFKDGGDITLSPGPEMSLYVNNRKTAVRDLARGDQLNFYVPEDRFAAHFAEDSAPTPQYVVVPIVYRETTTTYEPERTAAALPATASNSGLMLVFGGLLTAFGLLLVMRRHHR
jgi:LPXTG-motif cell wall-anchored protein